MMRSTLFLIAAASLALLYSTAAASDDKRKVTFTEETSCLDKMNEARQKAKLENLQPKARDEKSLQADSKPTGIWKNVCDALLGEGESDPSKKYEAPNTYALFRLSELTQGDDDQPRLSETQCSDAVKEWQNGFEEFKADPPVDEENEYSQVTSKQVFFMTLYNPKSGATGHCSVATCTEDLTLRDTENKTASGLVCFTSPNPFGEAPLFERGVWENIEKALTAAKEDEQNLTITDGSSCLTKLNGAREEAGLSALTKATILFPVADQETTTSSVFKAVCDTLLTGKDFKPSGELISSGSLAVFKLSQEGEEGSLENREMTPTDAQCSAAVEEWQRGFKAFEDDPPVHKGVKYSEVTSKQVSFVTLYNPFSEAKGQCSVATCKVPKDTGDDREEKTVRGLVCSTSPNAFGKESLFTQKQWDNINSVLSNSAAATVPSVLASATIVASALLS